MSASTHIMVDLETFGTRPGCVIRSIGAIPFNPTTGYVDRAGFYANVSRESCEAVGLTVDPETEAWWAGQSEEAQKALNYGQESLPDALDRFSRWWNEASGEQFWANDPDFDATILDAAYRACDMLPPWKFWATRSCRTVRDQTGVQPNRRNGVHHNAISDAFNQAVAVADGYRKLGLQKRPPFKIRLHVNLKPNPGCSHGPQTWSWWRVIGFLFCRLDVTRPTTGYRLWWYTRKGGRYAQIILDRRQGAHG